jgi:hypothetical protein
MSTDLELVQTHPDVDILLPADVGLVKQAMTAYLETTRAVLDDNDWQGRPNVKGSFITKSGWQKIAKAYRLSTELVDQQVERDDEGQVLRAAVVMRAIAPNGQYREATGYCSITEARFATQGGRAKLENDLRNTAATRAENRAISNLCGLGAVSAEEASADDRGSNAPTIGIPPWAQPVDDVTSTASVLVDILNYADVPQAGDRVSAIGQTIFDNCDNTLPRCVHLALMELRTIILANKTAKDSDDS